MKAEACNILSLIFIAKLTCCHFAYAWVPNLSATGKIQNLVNKYRPVITSPKSALDSETKSKNDGGKKNMAGNIAFLLPSEGADSILSKFGSRSPVSCPTLAEACDHLGRKSFWFSDGTVESTVVKIPSEGVASVNKDFLKNVDVLIAWGLSKEEDLAFAKEIFKDRAQREPEQRYRQCQFALECSEKLDATVGPFSEASPTLESLFIPWSTDASARRLHKQMLGLFNRWTTDDFVVAMMIFFNQFSGSQIAWVMHSVDATWEKGPIRNAQEIFGMVSKCRSCIVKCVQDEKCRECIGKLTEMDSRDQVASYRTIVSYESDLLRDFSFCILQKNNVFKCDAEIPKIPVVFPITEWRGLPVIAEDTQRLLIGHLDDEDAPQLSLKTNVSWKVACGANVAYDQFPSQNQLFYKASNGRDMWYDPIFRVETLDGRDVWCKRHYKVRNGPVPGTFFFSFLDNGITSNEFWTIVAVAKDLSWIAFHYAGAAAAVGQRYLGGLLCTPDGSLPPEKDREEIWNAFRSAGIAPWELYVVNNDDNAPGAKAAGPPPLDYFREGVLAAKETQEAS